MKTHISFLAIFCMLISCTSSKRGDKDIQINFYPTSGENAIYSIKLSGNELTIKNNEPHDSSKTASFEKKLTDQQVQEIHNIAQKVQKRENTKAEIMLDAWRAEVIINEVKYYDESGIKIESLPEDIKQLFKVLTKESTVEIDLYSFS